MSSSRFRIELPKHIQGLSPYVPGKPIEETRREFKVKSVIKLASNENPLGPSPKAIRAAQKALKNTHRYPDASGFVLKAAIAKRLSKAAQFNLTDQNIILGNGSNEIIDTVIRCFCTPSDAILTSQAAFVAYRVCSSVQGVECIETALTFDGRFDLKAMVERLKETPRARVVFIANPNNPTGTYVNAKELHTFLSETVSLPRPPIVVIDDAYGEYVNAKDLPNPLVLFRSFPHVLVMKTFSKIYGLAGMRVGYAIGHSALVQPLEKVRQPFHVNSVALEAAAAALGDTSFVKKALRSNASGMKLWTKALNQLELSYYPSQGNFILVDLSPLTADAVYRGCLKQGVIFRPVANYGLPHSLRITIGTESENKRGIKTLTYVLKELWRTKE